MNEIDARARDLARKIATARSELMRIGVIRGDSLRRLDIQTRTA